MSNQLLPWTFAATFAFAAVNMGAAEAQGIQHFAVLNGGNEVSAAGAASAGDPDGSGAASIIVLGNRICYSILVERIGTPNAAHIHEAEAGANGPVVVTVPAGTNVEQLDSIRDWYLVQYGTRKLWVYFTGLRNR